MQKTVLITGAARRLGAAMAKGLAHRGYAVVIHYHQSRDEATGLVEKIREDGGTACAVHGDLTDENSTRELIAKSCGTLGSLGILINNASVFEDDVIGDHDSALWHKHFQIHVRAPALLAAEFSQQLPDDAKGLIVNIIDQRVLKPNPNFHSYTLSKSALWTATRTMAQALAPRIRVNAIGPGPTLPSFRQTQDQFDQQVKNLPLQLSPLLDDFAATIDFFANTESITGQMIALDGGQHLAWETEDMKVKE